MLVKNNSVLTCVGTAAVPTCIGTAVCWAIRNQPREAVPTCIGTAGFRSAEPNSSVSVPTCRDSGDDVTPHDEDSKKRAKAAKVASWFTPRARDSKIPLDENIALFPCLCGGVGCCLHQRHGIRAYSLSLCVEDGAGPAYSRRRTRLSLLSVWRMNWEMEGAVSARENSFSIACGRAAFAYMILTVWFFSVPCCLARKVLIGSACK